MLLRWKADNQLENWYSDLFVQYSQIVNRLAVYTEVFDNTTVMSATFSTFNASTQQWEEIDESTIALVGYRQDDARNGYLFTATMPVSVMMQDGVVGLALTAQTPTGYTDGNGDTVYQTQTSGIFKIFINKSLNNGTVPVPDNLNAIIQAIQNIDRNVIFADKFTASATTVSSQDPASATVTKDAETGVTNIAFDIPAGKDGVDGTNGKDGAKWYAGTQITGTGDNIEVDTVSGANVGDYYLNTQTDNIYVCIVGTSASTGASVWSYVGNIKGAKGDAGTFAISKVYSSVEAMNAGFSTDGLPIGALVVIETGNVDDPDNAKLYVKEANGYQFLTDMSGAKGIQGPAGVGITSIVKTSSNGLVDTYTIYYSDDTTSTFTVQNGAAGKDGVDGTNGKDGAKWFSNTLVFGKGAGIVVHSAFLSGAVVGDFSLNPTRGNIYKCVASYDQATQTSTWDYVGRLTSTKWYSASAHTYLVGTGTNIVATNIYDANVGDLYLVTDTENIYKCTSATDPNTNESTWTYLTNIKGTRGATWRVGTYITGTGSDIVVNFTGDGVKVGDLYLNTETAYVYRCKTVTHIQDEQYETVWTYETSIKGKAGEKWFTGTAVSGTGTDISVTGLSNVEVGDLYLNTTSGDVYECVYSFFVTQSSRWNWVANIKGQPGVSIVSITKTATNGLVDTYTIALSNGNTTTFDVTNGQQGEPGTTNYNDLTNKPIIPPNITSVEHQYAVSDSKTEISNATTWTSVTSGLTQRQRACIFANGYYVVCGTGGELAYSKDGATWTKVPVFVSGTLTNIAYGEGKYIALDEFSNLWMAEESPINWTKIRDGEDWLGAGVSSIIYANNQFVAVGEQVSAFSDDGIEWTQFEIVGDYNQIAFGNGRYVAVGANGAVGVSFDGKTWTTKNNPNVTGDLRAVVYAKGRFFIGGVDGLIMSTEDFETWDVATSNSAGVRYVRQIVYAENKFYAACYTSSGAGEIWVSTDGNAWTVQQQMPVRLWCLNYNEGRLICAGDSGAVYILDLGIEWTYKQTELEVGQYLWERVVVTFSDGNKIFSDAVCISGTGISIVGATITEV